MNKYRIELTESQLRAIDAACEVCARFKLGQPGTAVDMLAITDGAGRGIGGRELGHQLDALIKPLMGLDTNASFGVGQFDDADVLFDLHEVFRHRLAWDKAVVDGLTLPGGPRKWPEMMTVNYDEPMHWGTEPLATVTSTGPLVCLAEAAEGGHENYGTAFYSPPPSERTHEIEREWQARLLAVQAEHARYVLNAETAVKRSLGRRSDDQVSVGEESRMSECTEERFLKDVEQHELTIVRDDRVSRHLRFQRPGTYNRHFDLITWPGYLCYTGDMGTYVFRRMEDMLAFFRNDNRDFNRGGLSINPGYWGEKLEAIDNCDGYRQWSSHKFEQFIRDDFGGWLEDSELSDDQKTAATEQFESDVIRALGDGKEAAYLAARDFEFAGCSPFQDWWEVDTDDYSFRFLWCCYALAWGVQKYDEARRTGGPR